MVARGWSPTERTRVGFYLVVGLLLTLNPVAVQAFDLGEPRHQYRAYEVTVGEGVVSIAEDESASVITVSGVRGVDCSTFTLSASWRCVLEEHVAGTGGVTVNTTGYDSPRAPFVKLESGYYRRTVRERDGATTVSLNPVSARTVVDTVGVDLDDASATIERAVRQGTTTSAVETETGQYVRDGEQYYYVSRIGESDGVPWVPSALGATSGLALLARGHRLRIERRTDD
jgi:hypothetical protein